MTLSVPLPYQRPLDNPSQRLLVLGDSQAVGVGSSVPERSIAGLFAAAHPDWSVETVARSGAQLAEVIGMVSRASRPRYDLIIIFAGANDLIKLKPQSGIEKNLRQLISAAQPLAPHVAVSHGGNLGAAPRWPRFIAPYFTYRARRAQSTYRRLAQELGFIYLDLFEASEVDPSTHAPDGFHLNDAGYAGSFRVIQQILQQNGVKL